MSRTIAGFDLDELADRIILPALIVGKSRGLPGVDLAASVTFEALGDVPPEQLGDGHPVLGGTDPHAPGDVLGQDGLKPDVVDAHLRHGTHSATDPYLNAGIGEMNGCGSEGMRVRWHS
jgi:hypothetical protein